MTLDQYQALTRQQRASLAQVAERNGMTLDEAIDKALDLVDYVGIQLPYIFLGIEKDGYTHS